MPSKSLRKGKLVAVKWNHLIRRLHLYLALFLLPWFLMYGISSLVIHHRQRFQAEAENRPPWTETLRETYSLELDGDAELSDIAAKIAADKKLAGRWRGRKAEDIIQVTTEDFRSQTRAAFDPQQSLLIVEKRRFPFDEMLVMMHVRAGFSGPISHDLWAVVIDVVCLGFLAWVATGLYMWWKIRSTRGWGVAALVAGVVSFGLFLGNF